ncbi:MAG: hypothetical protein ACOZQL_39455 [Myxococcota bacterium]
MFAVITTLRPLDGVGTLTLDDGTTLRFGASACRGFTPAEGLRVRVVSTRPHPLGGVAAAELELATDAEAYDAAIAARDEAAGLRRRDDALTAAHTSLELGWLIVLLDEPVPTSPGAFLDWATGLGLPAAGVRVEPPPMTRLRLGAAEPLVYPGAEPFPRELLERRFGAAPWASGAKGFLGLSLGIPGNAPMLRLITRAEADPWGPAGRLRDLTRLAALLARRGPGVLLPQGHFALPRDTFLRRLGDLDDVENRPYMAWVSLSWDPDARRYRSHGMPALELFDVAAAAPVPSALDEQRAREATLFVCHHMVRESASLEPGAELEVPIGVSGASGLPLDLLGVDTERWRVSEAGALLELAPVDPQPLAARWAATPGGIAETTYLTLARAAMNEWHRGQFVGDVYLPPGEGAPGVFVEVHRVGQGTLMHTLGVGARTQPGGVAQDGTAWVELVAAMGPDHPMFARILGTVGQALQQHAADVPYRFGDTIRLPIAELGCAGFLLRDAGRLNLGAGSRSR